MDNIFHLVYISEAVADISYTDIRDILEVGRKRNLQDDVTGLLIFRDGYFVQLLEGNEVNVRKVLNRILLDDRNYSLRILTESTSEQRLFDNNPLAFYDGDISSNSTEDLSSLFEACMASDIKQTNEVIPLLWKFRATAPEFK